MRTAAPRIAPDSASRRHRIALAGGAAVGAVVVAAIVARLGIDEHWPVDHAVRATLATHGRRKTRAALRVAGSAGTVVVYLPAAAMATALVAHRSGARRGTPIMGSVAAAAAMSWLLKRAVRRTRPVPKSGVVNGKPSFPSGHASRATAAGMVIAYVLVRERVVPAMVALPIAASLAAATGLSRAYDDEHWTTDVIGGWALGGATSAAGALWYERMLANG